MDHLSTQLAQTKLDNKLLVIDALNYLSTFVEIDWIKQYGLKAPDLFKITKERVSIFADAAKTPSNGIVGAPLARRCLP